MEIPIIVETNEESITAELLKTIQDEEKEEGYTVEEKKQPVEIKQKQRFTPKQKGKHCIGTWFDTSEIEQIDQVIKDSSEKDNQQYNRSSFGKKAIIEYLDKFFKQQKQQYKEQS